MKRTIEAKTSDGGGQLQRKKNRVRMLIFGFFLFLAIVMVLESPLTRVRNVTVTGNTSVPAQDIVTASGLRKGMSIWQVNQSTVETHVTAGEPRVQSVTVHTDYFSGTVTLGVKEKAIVAVLATSGHFYTLLSDGKVYTSVAANTGFTWPLVTTDGTLEVHVGQEADPSVSVVCEQLAKVPRSVSNEISEIHVDHLGVATIYLINHFAAQCKQEQLADSMSGIDSAVQYFKGKGYAPGLIDMTGGQPYRYTPFTAPTEGKG